MGFINKNSVEKIEKQGNGNPIRGIKSCKTFRKALQTLIGQYYKRGNTELEFHTRGILELYNKYHPEKKAQVEVESWKGKERNLERYNVTLDKEIVDKAKNLQKELGGAVNLSALLNETLSRWIVQAEEALRHLVIAVKKAKVATERTEKLLEKIKEEGKKDGKVKH